MARLSGVELENKVQEIAAIIRNPKRRPLRAPHASGRYIEFIYNPLADGSCSASIATSPS